jgi:hypothetical protein
MSFINPKIKQKLKNQLEFKKKIELISTFLGKKMAKEHPSKTLFIEWNPLTQKNNLFL